MSDQGFLIYRLKDTAILVAWILGLLLIAGLSWGLTGSIRSVLLQDSINRSLVKTGDSRRLEAPLAQGAVKPSRAFGPVSPLGAWYSLSGSANRAFFFTLMGDGTFLPCAAIVNPQGKVIDIIPLSSRGEKRLSQVSPGIIALYVRRIEGGL